MPYASRTINQKQLTKNNYKNRQLSIVNCQMFKNGFSLIEIVLSTFLILIFVSIVLSASGTYLTTRRSNLAQIASKITSRQFESLRQTTFDDITQPPPGTTIQDLDLAKLPNGVITRTVTNYQSSGKIKQVITDITWTENNAPRELKMVSLFTENGL